MKLVFFGTPVFAAKILEYLSTSHSKHSVVGIVSKPDKHQGRGRHLTKTPVHETADKLFPAVPFFQPAKASDPAFQESLKELHADAFVVVAYGELIKKSLLDMPRYGCFNVHASLLPHLRGAAPIHRSIMIGDTRTGITIMKMDVGLDTGDMLLKTEVPILENDFFVDVEEALLEAAKVSLVQALDSIEARQAVYVQQKNEHATFAPKIVDCDLCLDPRMDVRHLHNTIRALSPKPAAFFWLNIRGKRVRLKVLSSRVVPETYSSSVPTFRLHEGYIALVNQTGMLLFVRVQPENKPSMDAKEFVKGYPLSCIEFDENL